MKAFRILLQANDYEVVIWRAIKCAEEYAKKCINVLVLSLVHLVLRRFFIDKIGIQFSTASPLKDFEASSRSSEAS